MSDNLPGKGLFGWFGRQVGYVKKAVRAKPAALPRPPAPAHQPQSPAPSDVSAAKVYENRKVEEVPHPENPHITLRRTIIDEAIVRDESVREKPVRDEPAGQ